MSKKDTKRPTPPPRPPLRRRNPEELQTIAALKRMIKRMQFAGVAFLLAGIFMPGYSPYFAQKGWRLIFSKTTVPWYKVCIVAGCVMLIVSIFCFLRSYRCPKCGMLLALTPYTRITKCRSCGVKLNEKDHYLSKGD